MATQEVPMKTYLKEIVSQFFLDTPLNCYMLNVAHVTNDVKWRHMKVILCVWIDNDPINALYEFQIGISTNSREIKYQNMGIGLLHVKRRTRHKWR